MFLICSLTASLMYRDSNEPLQSQHTDNIGTIINRVSIAHSDPPQQKNIGTYYHVNGFQLYASLIGITSVPCYVLLIAATKLLSGNDREVLEPHDNTMNIDGTHNVLLSFLLAVYAYCVLLSLFHNISLFRSLN